MKKSVQFVLMIDDDEDDQMLFKQALTEVNNSVTFSTASNGYDALKKLETPPPPDIIFLDLNMPIMNGFECLTALKKEKRYEHIPVIIFTTANDAGTIDQTRKLGASAFFHKPIDFGHLIKKLDKLINFKSDKENEIFSISEFVL